MEANERRKRLVNGGAREEIFATLSPKLVY